MVLQELKVKSLKNHFSFEIKKEFLDKNFKGATPQEKESFFNFFWKLNFPLAHRLYKLLYIYTMLKKYFEYNITLFALTLNTLCWFYILLSANYTYLSDDFFIFLELFQIKLEPFSELHLSDENQIDI
jgi:hypothetical protein